MICTCWDFDPETATFRGKCPSCKHREEQLEHLPSIDVYVDRFGDEILD